MRRTYGRTDGQPKKEQWGIKGRSEFFENSSILGKRGFPYLWQELYSLQGSSLWGSRELSDAVFNICFCDNLMFENVQMARSKSGNKQNSQSLTEPAARCMPQFNCNFIVWCYVFVEIDCFIKKIYHPLRCYWYSQVPRLTWVGEPDYYWYHLSDSMENWKLLLHSVVELGFSPLWVQLGLFSTVGFIGAGHATCGSKVASGGVEVGPSAQTKDHLRFGHIAWIHIQLLEYSKTSPSPPPPSPSSSSPSRSGYPPSISGTKCGIIDPLVSKRPKKISESEN